MDVSGFLGRDKQCNKNMIFECITELGQHFSLVLFMSAGQALFHLTTVRFVNNIQNNCIDCLFSYKIRLTYCMCLCVLSIKLLT